MVPLKHTQIIQPDTCKTDVGVDPQINLHTKKTFTLIEGVALISDSCKLTGSISYTYIRIRL